MTGLVPSLAMRSGDFSADPFGNAISPAGGPFVAAIVNPNMIGASTDPTAPVNIYFHCDPAGNPLPVAANGLQAPGHGVQQDSGGIV